MKGRLFSVTMLVIMLVLVLALPAQAGKPSPARSISVKNWHDPVAGTTWTPMLDGVNWQVAKGDQPAFLAYVVSVVPGDGSVQYQYITQDQPVSPGMKNVSVRQMVPPTLSFNVSSPPAGSQCQILQHVSLWNRDFSTAYAVAEKVYDLCAIPVPQS